MFSETTKAMALGRPFVQGAVRLLSGQSFVQLCSFVRSVILARLISSENLGIAATFSMTYALMEMASNVSAQTLLVQAPDGDDTGFQALLSDLGSENPYRTKTRRG